MKSKYKLRTPNAGFFNQIQDFLCFSNKNSEKKNYIL